MNKTMYLLSIKDDGGVYPVGVYTENRAAVRKACKCLIQYLYSDVEVRVDYMTKRKQDIIDFETLMSTEISESIRGINIFDMQGRRLKRASILKIDVDR